MGPRRRLNENTSKPKHRQRTVANSHHNGRPRVRRSTACAWFAAAIRRTAHADRWPTLVSKQQLQSPQSLCISPFVSGACGTPPDGFAACRTGTRTTTASGPQRCSTKTLRRLHHPSAPHRCISTSPARARASGAFRLWCNKGRSAGGCPLTDTSGKQQRPLGAGGHHASATLQKASSAAAVETDPSPARCRPAPRAAASCVCASMDVQLVERLVPPPHGAALCDWSIRNAAFAPPGAVL